MRLVLLFVVVAASAAAANDAANDAVGDAAGDVVGADADADAVVDDVAVGVAADAADAEDDAADADDAADTPPKPPPLDDHLRDLDQAGGMGAIEMMGSFARSMLMLCVVLGIAWLTLSKGLGKLVERANAGKRVKVIERVALDARRSVYLVELDGKEILLGGGDVVRLSGTDGAVPFSAVLGGAAASKKSTADEDRPAPPPPENA
jgi:flagellar protein FliO/FliZ